jgi:SOS-response transcriptional repressor LexA
MGWASHYIEKLKQAETVQFRPRGNSMTGKIESGQLVTVEPIKEIEVDDIVLCKVRGKEYLHIVKAKDKDRYLIGNNRGVTNGWIGRNAIFGKLVKIEP